MCPQPPDPAALPLQPEAHLLAWTHLPPAPTTDLFWSDFRFDLRLLKARVQASFRIQAYVSTCMNPLLSLRELFVQAGN